MAGLCYPPFKFDINDSDDDDGDDGRNDYGPCRCRVLGQYLG